MKKIFVLTTTHLVEVDESFDWNSNEAETFMHNVGIASLGKTQRNFMVDKNHKAKWESAVYQLYDPKTDNCGQCSRCKAWVSDREKPNSINSLAIAATVNGTLLCDECLPKDHPLAF